MRKILFLGVSLLLPLFACSQITLQDVSSGIAITDSGLARLNEVYKTIDLYYTETPNMKHLSEVAIRSMLKELDPHSVYIPPEEVKRANEGLQGNFEGVGISFQIVDDTIVAVDVIQGGPASKVGVQSGDKIVRIDGNPATGDSINNRYVFTHLRGPKGTTVVVDVLRFGEILSFHIERDKIPIYSVESSFVVDDSIGYIHLSRFARTSLKEFLTAAEQLRKEGMTCLILDLRGNSGGYLDIAVDLANMFLNNGNLIVYSDGRQQGRREYKARGKGPMTGRLVVLVNEESASASEIVSGAMQDWDRGTIIGRRTFGKGLVQRVFTLENGGQLRLTTARYFTPSGRCVQKPYGAGTDYSKDLSNRYKSGELVNADSIKVPDSLIFHTNAGRVVYGGGGIIPDIFVPIDTMKMTDFFITARRKGFINRFPLVWVNQHRNDPEVADFESFLANYEKFKIDKLFEEYCKSHELERDRKAERKNAEKTAHTEKHLHTLLKSLVARDLFGPTYYYKVTCKDDEVFNRAIEYLKTNQ